MRFYFVSLLVLAGVFCHGQQYNVLAIQDFDTIQTPAWLYVVNSGNMEFANGFSPAAALPSNSPLGINGSWAWKQEGQGAGVTLEFDNINIAGFDTVIVMFKLAAFAMTGSNGLDELDHVTVAISINNGSTWHNQVRVNGAGAGNSSWAYSATGVAERVYSMATATTFAPPASGLTPAGFSTVRVIVPNTTNQVKLRITSRSSMNVERYCIDDVQLLTKQTATDAGLSAFVNPSTNICGGNQDIIVNLKNHGPVTLTSVDINCKVNNTNLTTYNWTGSLGVNDSVNVNIGSFNFVAASQYNLIAYTSNPNNLTDNNSSNDTVSIIGVTALPEFVGTVTPSGQVTICDGDSFLLRVVSPAANSFQWFYNGQIIPGANDSLYYIKQAGYYIAWYSDGMCIKISDTIFATTQTSPPSTISYYTPTTFCYGDSVWLFGNTTSGITYQWQRDGLTIPGATASTYLAKESGSYTLKTTNVGNCSTTSAAVIIDAKAVHLLNLGNDMVVCENIVVTLDAGPGADTYLWSTGSTSQTITLDTAIAGLGAKTYSITASLNGCESSDEVVIEFIICSGIEEIYNSKAYKIFPNPGEGRFYVELKIDYNSEIRITVKDLKGVLIHSEIYPSGKYQQELRLEWLPKGVYIMQIKSDDFSFSEKLLIY